MPPDVHRTNSLEQRLRHPNAPLVIRTQEHFMEGHDSDSASSFCTVSNSPDSSELAKDFTFLLDREHRVNRIQAEENNQLRNEIRFLRDLAEAMPNNSIQPTPRRSKIRVHGTARGSQDLFDENAKLHFRIKTLEKELCIRDRQVDELQTQLHEISSRLNNAVRSLEAKEKELDTYIVPVSEYRPVKAVSDAFHKMTLGELNSASLALGGAMSEARNKLNVANPASSVQSGPFYNAARRPMSSVYSPRSQSSLGVHKEPRVNASAGTFTAVSTPLGSDFQSIAESVPGAEAPAEQKHVKWEDVEGKKRKTKFSASRFWGKSDSVRKK